MFTMGEKSWDRKLFYCSFRDRKGERSNIEENGKKYKQQYNQQ